MLFSPYREDSQVRRINRAQLAVEDAHPLVSEVAGLCDIACLLTGGSFDAWRPDGTGRRAFDPTGLVKGWAVQRAAEHLAAGLGCDVSINAGGDIAIQPGGDPAPWRVGIEDPTDPLRVLAVVPVLAGGIATSGTARRGRHIGDPRDGAAADDLLSVTVVGPSLLWASTWSRGRSATRRWSSTARGSGRRPGSCRDLRR